MIVIYRGEDTEFANSDPIPITLNTEMDLTGYTAKLYFGNVVKSYGPEDVETKSLPLAFTAAETEGFFPGKGYATVKVYDTENRVRIMKHFVIDVEFRDDDKKKLMHW